ncbi:MAG TPA: DUF378 domain-containing protein [Gemmatimonadales bacterium]|nr:DUF378 domain-containing protein [Gemmatimonadales bacterium]
MPKQSVYAGHATRYPADERPRVIVVTSNVCLPDHLAPSRTDAAKISDFAEAYMKALDNITAVLLIIGGLNWGLVGAANFDLVAALFGEMSPLSRVVYVLVGLSALYQALRWKAIHHSATASPMRTRSTAV